MPDNLLLPICLDRLTDADGVIVPNGKVHVYDAGTTDYKDVFTDFSLSTAAANPIVADSGGYLAPRYIGTGSYKLVITDADDATLKSEDDLPGALDTSSFLTGSITAEFPIVTKTSDYTILTTDKGKIFNGDPTGGAFTFTLPSAITAGDGFSVTIRHVGTANQIKVTAVSGQTIDNSSARSLVAQYEGFTIVSDGANWHIKSYTPGIITFGHVPNLTVVDITATPPGSPNPGARYIVAASPSGAWSAFSQHSIAEADGQGNWIEITPDEGWQAWVADEDADYIFDGSAWHIHSNLPRGYIDGCTIANNSTDATNDIDFSAGSCRDSTDAQDIFCSAMTKRLDAVWSAGTGNGMKSSSSLADGTWHLFAIAKADGTQDWLAHDGVDPTSELPSGYTVFRRVGSIIRSSSAILAFKQVSDDFLLSTPVRDINETNPGTSAVTRTLTVPTGINVKAYLNVTLTRGSSPPTGIYFSSLDQSDLAPSMTAAPLCQIGGTGASDTDRVVGIVSVWTNTSAQIRSRNLVSNAAVDLRVATMGWRDPRGKT